MTLLGDGMGVQNNQGFPEASIRKLSDGSEPHWLLNIASSAVTIDGLRLVGYQSPSATTDGLVDLNTWGVRGFGASIEMPLRDLTVRNCRLEAMWRAVSLMFATDVVVANNSVERSAYGGIYLTSVVRGQVRNNLVIDTGNSASVANLPTNAYPIVVSSTGTDAGPNCRDILIADNEVHLNPLWTGIMNHASVIG